jgi:four helix bundle protein
MLRLGVGMQTSHGSSVFHRSSPSSAVEHAIEFVELARPLLEAVQRRDRDLASQMRRAVSSVALNLAEGFGVAGGNGRLRFETALGSLNEAETAIRVAVAWGYVSQANANPALRCAKPLGARVAGLAKR